MHRCFETVFLLVTVVSSLHVHLSSSQLITSYSITRTHEATQAFIRLGLSSPSFTLALQTDLTNCCSKISANYTGLALWMQGSYTGHTLTVKASGNQAARDVASHRELLNIAWRRPGEEENLIVAMPKATLSLATGFDDEARAQWWLLRTRSNEELQEIKEPSLLHPNQDETKVGRGLLMRTHSDDNIWSLVVNTFLPDERPCLLNLTFTAHHREEWQMSLQVPILFIVLKWDSRMWKSQGKQHWQVSGEVRSTESNASLKFIHIQQEQAKKAEVMDSGSEYDTNCEVKGCEDNKLHIKSRHHNNNNCCPDLQKSQKADLSCVCSGQGHKPKDTKECLRYEEDDSDSTNANLIKRCCEEAADARQSGSVPSEATQEIREQITSGFINFSSNMTVFVLPDGRSSIRILQHSHLAFCPRLSWNLNQIFRFGRDRSGWEYVVSVWEWGSMVVRGEWGASFLQWYQKTFTFSFDQDAALPSTQLVLDFRDWRKFKVWMKWPALASALSTSLTLENDHAKFLVEKVDEFEGEDEAEVVTRVVAQGTPAGVQLSCFANTTRIQELYAAASALLTQVFTSHDMCGGVPDHATIQRFLHDLLGQSPASLWADLLHQGHRLLLESGFETDLSYLWELFREEMGTGEESLWDVAWRAMEQAGLVRSRGEEMVVVMVPWEWIELAQRWWAWVMDVSGRGCQDETLLVTFLMALINTLLGRGNHPVPHETF